MIKGITINKLSEWLVYLTIAILPFYIFRFSVLGIRTNVLEVIILLNFAITLYFKFKERKLSDFKTELVYSIIALLVAVIIGVAVGGFSSEGLGILKGWFLIPIMFFYNFRLNLKGKEIKSSLLYLSIPIFLVSLLAILQKTELISTVFYQRGDYTFSDYLVQGRSFSLFESPNFLAMFLVPTTLLLLGAKETVKRQYRTCYWLFFLLPLLSVYFSGSRAGLIALILGAIIYIISNYWKAQLKSFKEYIPAFLVAFFVVLNISYLYFSTEAYAATRGGDNVRIGIYKYSLQLLKDNWLFGVGLGQFQEKVALLSLDNLSFQYSGLSYALHPHNLMLAIWLNLGLLGIVSFLSFLYLISRKMVENINSFSLSILAALFAILIHGLFDTTYFKNDLAVIFWLISAIVLTINPDEKQTTKN